MARTIRYEMTDADVYKNAVDAAGAMEKIRAESLANKAIVNESDYSSLAKRLASCIKSMAGLAGNAKALDAELAKVPDLYNFDPLQLRYWKERPESAEFMRALSSFAMSTLKPTDFVDFFRQNMEYHTLQALKQLDGREAKPVTQLPMERVMENISADQSLESMVEVYSNAGLMALQMKAKSPGKAADTLRKKGYEVMPNGDSIKVTFKTDKDMDIFFSVVFGYSKLKEFHDNYYAKAKDGYVLLDKAGNHVGPNENLTAIVQKNDVLELKSAKGLAYFSGGKMLFYGKWFGRPLNDNHRKILGELHDSLGEEVTAWALRMSNPLEYIYSLDREALKKVHALGVEPSTTLIENVGSIDAPKLEEFVKIYERVKADEIDSQTLWQMLDKIDDDAAKEYIQLMASCYSKKGDKTKGIIETYQANRSEHPSHISPAR